MARFSYRGTDEQGIDRIGEVESESLLEASRKLRERGITAYTLERDDWEEIAKPLDEIDAFSYFNRSLAALSRVGIPLPTAIREISLGLRRGRFKNEVLRIESSLQEGKSLAEAIAEAQGAFPAYYTAMVQAGAESGNLPRVLHAVARTHESHRRVRRAIVAALAYPTIVLVTGVMLTVLFGIFLLPKQRILKAQVERRSEVTEQGSLYGLPWEATLPMLLFPAILVVGCGLALWFRRSARGERVLFRIPWVGEMMKTFTSARFFGTLSLLLQSGAALKDAVAVSVGASGSRQLSTDRDRLVARAAEGQKLSDLLRDSTVISPEVVGYLLVAEDAGRLPDATGQLGEVLTEQSAGASDDLYVVLFPLAILVTGFVVGSGLILFAADYIEFLRGFIFWR